MKIRLSAAALAAFACGAQAQSSVTLFGMVDTGLRSVSNGGVRVTQVAADGLTGSRLGFRTEEDLGGGMKAGAWLETAVSPDTGSLHPSGKFWHRRATVSLSGPWGELRGGRDVSPPFWNQIFFDPLGASGVGSTFNLLSSLGSGAATVVRTDNAIGYFLPANLGGIHGQLMWAPGEGVPGNRYASGRLGYKGETLHVAASYSTTETAIADDYKVMNAGATYDLKTVKLFALGNIAKFGNKKQTNMEVGLTIPIGVGLFRASYQYADASGVGTDANDARQIAVGYVHNLSNRTAVYGTASHLRNRGAAAFAVSPPPSVTAGGKSKGYEVGVRHVF